MPPSLLITSRPEVDLARLPGDRGSALLVGEDVGCVDGIETHDLRRAAAFHGPHGVRLLSNAGGPARRLAALLLADQRVVAAREAGARLRAMDEVAAEALALDLELDGPAGYRAARAEALRLVYAGRAAEAEDVVRAHLARVRRPRVRADLLGEVAWAQLGRGERSGLVLEATAATLALADRHFAAGRTRAAASTFHDALRLAYHRGLHLDATTSPLAEDPEGFAAVFGSSVVARRVRGADGPHRPRRSVPRGSRVLILTWGNANFVGELLRSLEDDASAQVRFVDLAALPDGPGLASSDHLALAALDASVADPDPGAWVEEHLRADLDWADTVFLEWCTAGSALVTRVDLSPARVVLRLHSGEAFLPWPQLVDWSRVDEVVFVSEHLRDHAAQSIPGLQGDTAPRLSVAPLTVDLDRFACVDRPDGARFVLGMVGWSAIAKDVRWALELLTELRAHDPRFRLRLVGAEPGDEASPAAVAYQRSVRALLEPLVAEGAVEVVGATDDVPGALAGVGIIVSTSVRESFHAALLEGAATGAAPVVRDWPFFAGRPHGARSVYPPDWVVADHREAVRRILALAADPEEWRRCGREAAEAARARYAPGASLAAYRRLLLGER